MTAGRNAISTKKEWNTPPKYASIIHAFFNGKLELDPCSNEFSTIQSKIKYTLPTDGLKESWNFKSVFVNPPFGRNPDKTTIYDWILKGVEADTEILYLIPVATNTKHFKNLIFKHGCGICFLEDTRLKFWSEGSEDKKGAPMACCFVYFGKNYDKFNSYFNEYGKCFEI